MALTDKNRKLIGAIVAMLSSVTTIYLAPEKADLIVGLLTTIYGLFVGGNLVEHKMKNGTPVAPP